MLSDRKEKYTDFLKEVDSPSIFVQPWWLDTVCGKESWQVILIERDNRVVASLPIYTKKKIFYNLISSPL